MELPSSASRRLIKCLRSYEPGNRETNQPLNSVVSSSDIGVMSCFKAVIYRVVCAMRLREECEDCVQEALVRFSKTTRERPGQPFSWYLGDCCWFIRDVLKRGRSLDSPKRRWLGYSFDSTKAKQDVWNVASLVSSIDPSQHASAVDDLEQMRIRLTPGDQLILQLFLEGNGNREVARCIHKSPSAVGKSRVRICGVALKIGLIAYEPNRLCNVKNEKR